MKYLKMRSILLLSFLAGLGLSMFSCSNEKKDNDPIKSLYAVGIKASQTNLDISTGCPTDDVQLFKGEDIQSFNLTTGEIIFNVSLDQLNKFWNCFSYLSLFSDEKTLFEAIPITHAVSSFLYNDLVFYIGVKDSMSDTFELNYFLKFGWPPIQDVWPEKDKEAWQKEREKNAKKHKNNWDSFINFLREEGKIVE